MGRINEIKTRLGEILVMRNIKKRMDKKRRVK